MARHDLSSPHPSASAPETSVSGATFMKQDELKKMNKKLSWQGRIVKLILRRIIKRLFKQGLPADELRARLTQTSGLTRFLFKSKNRPKASTINGVKAEWCGNPECEKTILYLHGGAYVFGGPSSHRGLVRGLCKATNTRALIVDYRLAPEHPFPAALDDALACYEALLADNIAPNQIIIAGDSAGGGLSAALMLKLRDDNKPLPAAGVLLSPWTDLTGSGDSVVTREPIEDMLYGPMVKQAGRFYTADTPADHPYISPLFADLKDLPPLLIHVGTDEILFDDATRFHDKAQAAGVDTRLETFYRMPHVFHMFHEVLPEARLALRDIGDFVQKLP